MQREHLLTAALADDTRFGIYRFIAEQPGNAVSVLDVAERFGLHPNVARMHLGKLEQAGFLASTQRKGAAGGRPAKLFTMAEGVRTFAFPPRRYELLAELALEVVAAIGDTTTVERICRQAGNVEGRRYVADQGSRPEIPDGLVGAVRVVTKAQGLLPDVVWRDGRLHVDVRNCVFREAAVGQPALACIIHRAYLQGMVESLCDGHTALVCAEGVGIGGGADQCHLVCVVSDSGEDA